MARGEPRPRPASPRPPVRSRGPPPGRVASIARRPARHRGRQAGGDVQNGSSGVDTAHVKPITRLRAAAAGALISLLAVPALASAAQPGITPLGYTDGT